MSEAKFGKSYILFVTNADNFKIFDQKHILGFKQLRKNYATKTHSGDQLVCYIGGGGETSWNFQDRIGNV